MLEKPALVSTPIHDLLTKRWSPRAFDPTRTVSRNQLLALLEAARWAPSCYGEEPWRFIVWDQSQDAASWQKAYACLSEGNRVWAKNAPLLILAASEPKFTHSGNDNRWYQYDTGAAALSLCLQAVALGLDAHQMGGFDVEQLRSAFEIPEAIALMSMIAVGYAADPTTLEGELRIRENSPRSRRPLSTRFFLGNWGKPYE